ncbi:MAG: Gfo/Idh/MocA family oxidoreductase [Pseudomonadota bacterium]
MTRTIRYGIAGTGMMGLEHIQNIALLEDAETTATYEPDPKQRQIAAARVPKANQHDSFDALVEDDSIDCLVIASPNYLHMDQLEGALARRKIPVLVEKPLFTHPADRVRLDRLMASNPNVWVAMEYRYMPPIATLLERAAEVTGGIKMLTIREHRFPFLEKIGDWNRFNRFTGGTLVEKCCHFFDLMRLMTGAEPSRVMASAGQAVNHRDERYLGQIPDIWDNGYAIVEFPHGVRAMLELCMFAEGSRFQEEITAVGPLGKIEARVPGPTRFWPAHLGAPPIAEVVISPRTPKGPQTVDVPVDQRLLEAGDHNGSTFYQHQRFKEFVLRGGLPDVSLHDGKMAVLMGLAAQQSATEGTAVALTVEEKPDGTATRLAEAAS